MSDDYLFVYGTLRRGFKHPLADLLARQADFVGVGAFQGVLYDLGSYPGVKPSSRSADVVVGDVYRLHHPLQLLPKFDRYEEYYPANPARSIYLRRRAPIAMENGHALQAWIYLYNQPVQGYKQIKSGDYLHYLSEHHSATLPTPLSAGE